MKRINANMVKGAFLGALLLLGATSCSDDHFDVIPESASGAQTLWENIQSNGETNDMAAIMRRTIVMKSETDRQGYRNGEMLTYDKLLSDPQAYTVWAPKDGTYDASYYTNLLDQRDAALAADATDRDAWALNWAVANQFVLNHIARFNYEGVRERQKVRMLNSKVSYYDASNNIFNTVAMDAAPAINSSNGTLHFLSTVSPFSYNIYDFIASREDFSKMWEVLSDPAVDHQEFSEAASTEGAIDENGNMVYPDSVFINYNDILNRCGAQIRNEDSVYVALLPSDACWDDAFAKVKSLFSYGKSYAYGWNRTKGEFENKDADAYRFNTDSLATYETNMALISSAFFTSSRFPVENKADSAEVVGYALTADSIISTNNVIYYNSNIGGENPIFNGQKPVRASNGFVFPVDNYTVDPAYSFISKNDFSLQYGSFYVANAKGTIEEENRDWSEFITLTAETRNEEVKGELEDDMYRRFEQNGSSNMQVDIRLPNIYSGRYKISAVMVPNRIHVGKINRDKGEEVDEHTLFSCRLYDDAGEIIGSETATIEVDPDTIQTYVLFEDVTFSKCYVNLPDGYESFPRLRFILSRRNKMRSKNSLNIARIIIEPVRE